MLVLIIYLQTCGKGFGRADLLKRHRNNHADDGNSGKKRRFNAIPGASRVSHACQACAKARVKCEDSKPCTRCRQRNLTCEYASVEASNAAAMHLMHLSSSQSLSPPAPMATANQTNIATPPSFGSGSMPYQVAQPATLQGMQHPAAAGITNSQYSQSTGNSPPVLANDPRATREAAQLPTPEAITDHGELPFPSIISFATSLFLPGAVRCSLLISTPRSCNSIFLISPPYRLRLNKTVFCTLTCPLPTPLFLKELYTPITRILATPIQKWVVDTDHGLRRPRRRIPVTLPA